jgi:hypothetical protein
MKRLALALVAALFATGLSTSLVQAGPQPPDSRHPRVSKSGDDAAGPAQAKHSPTHVVRHSGRRTPDPVRVALARKGPGAIEGRFFDGKGYQTANQHVAFPQLHLGRKNHDGSYNVWFNHLKYRATAKPVNGQTILYVGTAPTAEGYLFEFVLQR